VARKVVWSQRAQTDRIEILGYWNDRNRSVSYARKLIALFVIAISQLASYPEVGKPTDLEGVRIKRVRDYLIFYEASNEEILVLTIWDRRRNPRNLGLR
jgi:plasmid stabilization system protein ParE